MNFSMASFPCSRKTFLAKANDASRSKIKEQQRVDAMVLSQSIRLRYVGLRVHWLFIPRREFGGTLIEKYVHVPLTHELVPSQF